MATDDPSRTRSRTSTAPARRAAGPLIFAAAAAVRLSLVRTSRFASDEAGFFATIRDLVEGRAFPLLGPPLSGGAARHPGALFFYLTAPSQLAWPTPEAANAWVALLGAAGVWLFWSAMRRVDEGGAAIAGVAMAFSPWSVLYADRLWNSNVVGLFVALAFWAAVRVREAPGTRWAALLTFSSLVMPQVHMSAPVAWAALAALVGRRRINLRWGALGAGAAGLLYAPYLASELMTGGANLANFLGEASRERARFPREVPLYLARFLTLDVSYHEVVAGSWPVPEADLVRVALWGSAVRPFHPLRLLALALSLVLAGLAVASALRRPEWRPFGRALLAGALADVALLGWSGKTFFPHYVQLLLPFAFSAFAMLPKRPFVVALVAAFCLGSLDASWSISWREDAKNGLVVQRRVIERLLPEGRVRLGLGFPGSLFTYATLSQRAYGGRLRFGDSGPAYLLLENGRVPPGEVGRADLGPAGRVALEPLEVIGPVTLYRVRP